MMICAPRSSTCFLYLIAKGSSLYVAERALALLSSIPAELIQIPVRRIINLQLFQLFPEEFMVTLRCREDIAADNMVELDPFRLFAQCKLPDPAGDFLLGDRAEQFRHR